jgi:hypothetical protein
MAWGIMMTAVMLFGMLGMAMFEVTTVYKVTATPEVDSDAEKKALKKAA